MPASCSDDSTLHSARIGTTQPPRLERADEAVRDAELALQAMQAVAGRTHPIMQSFWEALAKIKEAVRPPTPAFLPLGFGGTAVRGDMWLCRCCTTAELSYVRVPSQAHVCLELVFARPVVCPWALCALWSIMRTRGVLMPFGAADAHRGAQHTMRG